MGAMSSCSVEQHGTCEATKDSPWAVRIAVGSNAALCTCCAGSQAMWIPAFMAHGSLKLSLIGWIASGQLFLCGLTALLVAAAGQHVSPRRIVSGGAAVTALCYLGAMFRRP